MSNHNSRQTKVRDLVKLINQRYVAETLGDILNVNASVEDNLKAARAENTRRRISPVTTTYLVLNTIMGKNSFMDGDSGLGKTHSANVVSALLGGLPIDFYSSLSLEGVAGARETEMYSATHLPALANGEDSAYLFLGFQASVVNIDEIRRFDEYSQNLLRRGIKDGVWQYLGHFFEVPDQVVISAANSELYGGSFTLNENLLDSFPISLEPPKANPFAHREFVKLAAKRAKAELGNSDLMRAIREHYTEHKLDFENIQELLRKSTLKFRDELKGRHLGLTFPNGVTQIPIITEEDKIAINEEIENMSLTGDADLFFHTTVSEMGYLNKYGRNRFEDPQIDQNDNHDYPYAGAIVKTGLAGRVQTDWIRTAKAVAWYMGDSEVTEEHLVGTFPYVASHRLHLDQRFSAEIAENRRNCATSFAAANKVIEDVYDRFNGFSKKANEHMPAIREIINKAMGGEIDAMQAYGDLEKIRESVGLDHPLIRSLKEYLADYAMQQLQEYWD